MQNQESIGEFSECLEFIRGAFSSFGLQFKTVFGLISLFKRYRMGDKIEKLLKHENIHRNRTTHFYRNYFLADSECPHRRTLERNFGSPKQIRESLKRES